MGEDACSTSPHRTKLFGWFREKRRRKETEAVSPERRKYIFRSVSAWTSKVHQCDFILIAQWLILIKASE